MVLSEKSLHVNGRENSCSRCWGGEGGKGGGGFLPNFTGKLSRQMLAMFCLFFYAAKVTLYQR